MNGKMAIGVQTDTVHSTVGSSVNIWFQNNHISVSPPNNDHNHDHFVNINKSLKIVLFVDLAFGIQGRSIILYTLKKLQTALNIWAHRSTAQSIYFLFSHWITVDQFSLTSDINLVHLANNPKVSVLQANDKLVQKGDWWTWNQIQRFSTHWG